VLRAAVFNRAAPLRRGAFLAQQVYETPAVLAAMRMAMSDIVNLPLDPGKPPILILGGADDRLAPPAATKGLAAALGPDRTTLKIYPGHGHWMIDEPGLDRMVGDLDAWLLDRAK
jgi:pimeloyl-ACP methyl ester carboxylesterase